MKKISFRAPIDKDGVVEVEVEARPYARSSEDDKVLTGPHIRLEIDADWPTWENDRHRTNLVLNFTPSEFVKFTEQLAVAAKYLPKGFEDA